MAKAKVLYNRTTKAAAKKRKGVVPTQKRKAKRILNKAAKEADRQASRSKAAGVFRGGTPDNKARSAGPSMLAGGSRYTAIEHAKDTAKGRIKAARLRGAAKQIKK